MTTTRRLVLRAVREDDGERLVALDADPRVMRFLTGGRATPREVVLGRVLPRMRHRYACLSPGGGRAGARTGAAGAEGLPGYWIAEDARTGAWLGWFEFRPLEEGSAEVVELGYRLRRAVWGAGYATEGARALVRTGFTEFGVRRVTAGTMAVNAGSRRVMEKSGLRYVRTYTEDWPEPVEGAEHGEVEYAVTREEWLAAGR
ncbi:GNAT family N-acetyltransferase [Streptomyces sp. JJ36]|uniref:GNAT family N-acetyltransferase n=1 Tax=Streptomyces sp. JJ36 TaxID=2736645 RepID=UPI001F3255A5|nr:GNAT family N-acetyltransferase [Streptomyces sp. JJ36]